MSEQPKQPETKKTEDGHGPIFSTTCPAPHCGRQVSERRPGEARCVCGARVELKG